MKTNTSIWRTLVVLAFFVTCFIPEVKPQALDLYDGVVLPQVKENSHGPVMAPMDANILWDNGPLVTSTGNGFGGEDISLLQNISLTMSVLGFGHQISSGFKVADDFTISDPGGWDISGMTFYAYQTGSTTTSTITGVYFTIYDGDPMLAGTNVVFGDFITNRLSTSGFSNIFRVTETTPLDNNRPIMANYCSVNLHLNPGIYWIAWSTDGSLSSGPWAPPVTILGQTTTGNGLQYTTAWGGAYDNYAVLSQQDFPFIIYGSTPQTAVPVAGWALGIGLVLIIGLAILRYRRIV